MGEAKRRQLSDAIIDLPPRQVYIVPGPWLFGGGYRIVDAETGLSLYSCSYKDNAEDKAKRMGWEVIEFPKGRIRNDEI